MIPKKHRLNAAFRVLVDEAEDMTGYVQRCDESRAYDKAKIVREKVDEILACLKNNPTAAKPIYWKNAFGETETLCGYCTEDRAKHAKASQYSGNEEPTHLCGGCFEFGVEELKYNDIDVGHYGIMEADNA